MGDVANQVAEAGGAATGLMMGGIPGMAIGANAGGMFGGGGGGGIGDFLGLNSNRLDTSAFQPSAMENQFMQMLMNQANGQGAPTAAQTVLNQGLGQANSNAMALSASQRGVSPGLAAVLGARQQAANQQQAAQQAVILSAQEAQANQGLLAQLLMSQRQSAGQGAAASLQAEDAAAGRRMGLISGIGQGAVSLATAGMGKSTGGAPSPNASVPPAQGAGSYSSPYLGGDYTFSEGGKVPGKANVKGDSPKNDTVDAKLSPGEMVIPRSVVEKGPEAIEKFAAALLKKEGKNEKGK